MSDPAVFSTPQLLWIIPLEWLRWLLILVSTVVSGSVLVFTFLPVVRDHTKVTAATTLLTILVLHSLLAIGCKVSGPFSVWLESKNRFFIHYWNTMDPLDIEHVTHPLTS